MPSGCRLKRIQARIQGNVIGFNASCTSTYNDFVKRWKTPENSENNSRRILIDYAHVDLRSGPPPKNLLLLQRWNAYSCKIVFINKRKMIIIYPRVRKWEQKDRGTLRNILKTLTPAKYNTPCNWRGSWHYCDSTEKKLHMFAISTVLSHILFRIL